jgi:hypothetical protein
MKNFIFLIVLFFGCSNSKHLNNVNEDVIIVAMDHITNYYNSDTKVIKNEDEIFIANLREEELEEKMFLKDQNVTLDRNDVSLSELKTLETKLRQKYNKINFFNISQFESEREKAYKLNSPFKGWSIISYYSSKDYFFISLSFSFSANGASGGRVLVKHEKGKYKVKDFLAIET